MGRPSDVIIGLEVGAREIRATGFDPAGRELGAARRPLHARPLGSGRVELDPVRAWQTAVRVIHELAAAVPDLGRRTVALGLTGASGGLCLIDEDREPLAPVISPLDRRGWGASTGRDPGVPCTSNLLAALLRDRRGDLDHAALALDVKGWIHACLTGRPTRGTVDAALGFEDAAPGAGPHALDHLLPPAVSPRQTLGMCAAAAAMTGLRDETPVVLAPPAPLVAAAAAGAAEAGFEAAVAVLDDDAWLVRPPEPGVAAGGYVRLGPDLEERRLIAGGIGGAALDWLVGLAEDLFAAGGLIGLTRGELQTLIDERAGAARPGTHDVRGGPAGGAGPWMLNGLGEASMIGDLARAIYEGIGFAARAGLEAEGGPPREIRLAGSIVARAPARAIIPACLGAATRELHRSAPATVGAALHAARAIHEVSDLEAGADAWITPFLAPPAAPDPALVELYRGVFERWRRS
ncbi:MAG TPA: FGGY family carbohydrate kinase [Geminicoccaceae bacterium]